MNTSGGYKSETMYIDLSDYTNYLDLEEIERSMAHLLIDLSPGFIHDLNNLMGIVDNYKDIHLFGDGFSSDHARLSKVFDKILETNNHTRNFLYILNRDLNGDSNQISSLLNRIISLFRYKFSERNIKCEINVDSPYKFGIPTPFVNYIFITMLFYLIEISSSESAIKINVRENDDCLNFVMSRDCINSQLKVDSHNKLSGFDSPLARRLSEHLDSCNSYLAKIGVNPIGISAEKKDVNSQYYELSLSLPVNLFAGIEQASAGKTVCKPPAIASVDRKKTSSILVIDDEKLICDLIMSIFDDGEHHIDYALSIKEGFDKFMEKNYKIVICDYLLPGTTAKELIDKINKTTRKTKIIIITGCQEKNIDNELLKPPVYAILRKPFKIDDIVSLVEDLI